MSIETAAFNIENSTENAAISIEIRSKLRGNQAVAEAVRARAPGLAACGGPADVKELVQMVRRHRGILRQIQSKVSRTSK